MNNGKVCIPVCTQDVAQLSEMIDHAAGLGDLVELRLDCLDQSQLSEAGIGIGPNSIVTLRPKQQGGMRDLTLDARQTFWRTVADNCGADLEEDMIEIASSRGFDPKICSYHNFSNAAEDHSEIYQRLSATPADVIKIAIYADDIVDTIEVWKLLGRAKDDKREIIPIAMGEAGKWTRILGLAHGAYLTYAALETGSVTAPGQISAKDLLDVFRVKEIDESTEVYGILAGNTSYSMSPYIHNAAFKAAGLNSVFVPLQVTDLDKFIRRMVRPATRDVELNFRGFSVTNPHKQSIIGYLDGIDEAARNIGAVNTVKVVDGKLRGYNTDAEGFIQPLKNKFGDLADARVAVVGAGGAARACILALKQEGADVTLVARNHAQAENLSTRFDVKFSKLTTVDGQPTTVYSEFDIVVNATPLGTIGEQQEQTAANAEQLGGVKLVYDLVYNPAETRLISEAKAAGAAALGGIEMLLAQAVRQFQIWTGKPAPAAEMAAAARKRLYAS